MSSALPYVVLGYVALLGSQSLLDASPISRDLQGPNQNVRNDYTYTPGVGAHKIYTQSVSWNTARRNCEEDGAHLAIINSVAEAEAIVRLFEQSRAQEVYVGLHDLYNEEEFVTIHGDPIGRTGFNAWRSGEPNNYGGNEDCVVLDSHGELNDGQCATRGYFVCELREPRTTEPAPQALLITDTTPVNLSLA